MTHLRYYIHFLAGLWVDWSLHKSFDHFPADSSLLQLQLLILIERITSEELRGHLPGLLGTVVTAVKLNEMPETQGVRDILSRCQQ